MYPTRTYARRNLLKTKYNMTLDDYVSMWEAQGGKCLLCGKQETAKDRTGQIREWLSVDHDHKTGKVRGLLCHHCNAVLGHAQDDPELLRRMIRYLEEHNEQSRV